MMFRPLVLSIPSGGTQHFIARVLPSDLNDGMGTFTAQTHIPLGDKRGFFQLSLILQYKSVVSELARKSVMHTRLAFQPLLNSSGCSVLTVENEIETMLSSQKSQLRSNI